MTGYPTAELPDTPSPLRHDPCMPQKVRWNAIVEETWLQPLAFSLTPYTPEETSSESLHRKSVISLWHHYIKGMENKATNQEIGSVWKTVRTSHLRFSLFLFVCLHRPLTYKLLQLEVYMLHFQPYRGGPKVTGSQFAQMS